MQPPPAETRSKMEHGIYFWFKYNFQFYLRSLILNESWNNFLNGKRFLVTTTNQYWIVLHNSRKYVKNTLRRAWCDHKENFSKSWSSFPVTHIPTGVECASRTVDLLLTLAHWRRLWATRNRKMLIDRKQVQLLRYPCVKWSFWYSIKAFWF